MYLDGLTLDHFRNYRKKEICFSGKRIVLEGTNGSGKTNLLESIYILTLGRSFRTKEDRSMIMEGCDHFYLQGRFHEKKINHTIDISYHKSGTKKIRMNGKSVRQRDLLQRTGSVLFYTDDLNLVTGSSSGRRKYMDTVLCRTDMEYYDALVEYTSVQKKRNYLLKKKTGN